MPTIYTLTKPYLWYPVIGGIKWNQFTDPDLVESVVNRNNSM